VSTFFQDLTPDQVRHQGDISDVKAEDTRGLRVIEIMGEHYPSILTMKNGISKHIVGPEKQDNVTDISKRLYLYENFLSLLLKNKSYAITS
jgi:hypothetical protein